MIKEALDKTFGINSSVTTQAYYNVQVRDLITYKNSYTLQLGKETWDDQGEVLNHNQTKMTYFLEHLEKSEKPYLENHFIHSGFDNFTIITYHCQLTEYLDSDQFIYKAQPMLKFLSDRGVFLFGCDFTSDIQLGFDPDVLFTYNRS